jgi:hypothetical protein
VKSVREAAPLSPRWPRSAARRWLRVPSTPGRPRARPLRMARVGGMWENCGESASASFGTDHLSNAETPALAGISARWPVMGDTGLETAAGAD